MSELGLVTPAGKVVWGERQKQVNAFADVLRFSHTIKVLTDLVVL